MSSDSDRDDVFDEDMEALRRACMISGTAPDDIATAVGGASEDSDDSDDLDLPLAIQQRFSIPSSVVDSIPSVRSLRALLPSDSDEDDFETLQAIQRRFEQYQDASLKKKLPDFVDTYESTEQSYQDNKTSERTLSQEYSVNDNATYELAPTYGTRLRNLIQDSLQRHGPEDGAHNDSFTSETSSQFPKSCLMLVDALKKNRSLQKFVRNKMLHIEAKIAENKELRDRIKCILDFQAGCKRRAGKLLSQKKDPHVKLISLPKSRTSKIMMFDSSHGRTCLHYAAYYGYLNCLQAILSTARSSPIANSWGFGRFVIVRDNKGETPLHLAAKQRRSACVHALLDNGAHVHASTGTYGFPGSNALHLATRAGSLDSIRELLAWDVVRGEGMELELQGSIKNAVYSGPAENSHVEIYKMVMARFPVSLTKQPWSMSDREKLVKGIKQQYQEMMMLDSLELPSDRENVLGYLSSLEISSFGDCDVASERFGSFLPLVNWERLASMYFTGRTGSECEARWINSEDPLINKSSWTGGEEKKLLLICQESGVFDWISIASRLGTRRTPFQCLMHYQRSLNVHILKKDWTKDEDARLHAAVKRFGQNWQLVASNVEGRTGPQCSNRWRKSLQNRTVGRWSIDEDKRLKVAAILFGAKNWSKISQFIPGRSQSQCRERWVNCLDPSISLKAWTAEEDFRLNEGIEKFGYCWSEIATHVSHRTDSQCRRRWKVLFPDEVPLLQAARKMQRAALISNFVDREDERPLIGPSDFQAIAVQNLHACGTTEPSWKRNKSSSDTLKQTLQLNPTDSSFDDATASMETSSRDEETVYGDTTNTKMGRRKRKVRSKGKHKKGVQTTEHCDTASETIVTDSAAHADERISGSNGFSQSACPDVNDIIETSGTGRHEMATSQTKLCEYSTVLKCGKRGRYKLLPKRGKSAPSMQNGRVPLVNPTTRRYVNVEHGVSDNGTTRSNGFPQSVAATNSRDQNFKGRRSRESLRESVDDEMKLCEYIAIVKKGKRDKKKLQGRKSQRAKSTKNQEKVLPSKPHGFSEAVVADLMTADLDLCQDTARNGDSLLQDAKSSKIQSFEPPGFTGATLTDWGTVNVGLRQDTASISSGYTDILFGSASTGNAT